MYYHCSSIQGLKVLKPRKPEYFEKPGFVYMTTSLPMALMYGIRNFEYTYGYTKEGQIYYEEFFPNALRELYAEKAASLYICTPSAAETTEIPNEVVSKSPVTVAEERHIPDVLEAILEQERLGCLRIRRYHQLSERTLKWIRKTEAEEIREKNLLHIPGPMADYMKLRYPESWAMAERELTE